ncbi:MAG: hypothetical protein OHM56_00210 [Spiroplasma phoeniceum]|nr:MAG: hypothetical protein OHM57_12720 [Spiroplasma phoeniceum]UZQ32459.1 MAG: hypothetical protein OHM56_00210 [Spiroplasma phoeniceum]
MKFDKFNFINDKELLRLTGAKKATFNKRRPVRWTGKKQILWDCFFYFYIKQHKFICIIHRIVSLNLEFLS